MQINDQNYVDTAEKVILNLKNKKDKKGKTIPMVTMSKLRNLLAMAGDIYNEIMTSEDKTLAESICSRIAYLRVRFLYEAGRDNSVKDLVNESDIIQLLKNINGNRNNYILFHQYMEALVAFHKYYGGKDN